MILLYNIWNTPKGDNNDYFGHFPKLFMKNLLYAFTEPFDLVYDPFAGSGTTIDACKEMHRQFYVSDRKPDQSRPEIKKHDIKDGLPDDLPMPKMVFLDPPYWKQAENKYSEDSSDLGNMPLDDFNNNMSNLLIELQNRKIEKIACVIAPTQWSSDNHEFVDHIKYFDSILTKYKILMKCVLPYSTQQYNGTQVDIAKKEKILLNIIRDLYIWQYDI